MELMIVTAILVGLCAGPLFLALFLTIDCKPSSSSCRREEIECGSEFPVPDPELMQRSQKLKTIRALYLAERITQNEYEDLIGYVECGGLITMQGDKVGISDAGYARLQALRRR